MPTSAGIQFSFSQRAIGCSGVGSPPAQIVPRLHQFDPITEGIINVNAVVAFQRFIVPGAISGAPERSRQSWQVFDNEGRVSLPSRPKVRFDAEMHFERPTFEPATASVTKWAGFCRSGMPSVAS
jgi:hypothetical protein